MGSLLANLAMFGPRATILLFCAARVVRLAHYEKEREERMDRHPAGASRARGRIAGLLSIMFAAVGCGDDSDSSHEDSDAGGKHDTTPQSYRVQIEVPNVPPGTEGTKCLKVRLGNAADIKVGRVHNQLFGQSHHFIVSAVTDSSSDEAPLADCLPFKAPQIGAPLTVTQKHDEEITLPDGVGYALDAHQLMHLELHYINTTDQTVDIRAESELFPIEEDGKVQEAGFLIAGTMDISIPPKSTKSTGDIYLEIPEALKGVKYYAVTGHTHRFGTNISISTAPDHDGEGTPIYELSNFDWSAPDVKYFDPPLQVAAGGGFRVNCAWDNPTDQTVKYGESALTEMCFFWAYYYPKNPKQQTLIHRPGQPK